VCFCPTVSDSNCTRKYINDTDKFESALQAWQEYNPVRDEQYGQTGDSRTANEYKLYRYRTFGKDAAIFLLDTRSFRDDILPGTTLVSSELVSYALPPRRTMLGSAQLTDLLRDLREAQLDPEQA